MKWYLDEDLSPKVAEQLRRHGVDAVSAHDVGTQGRPDAEQLLWATHEHRVLVTYNVRHYAPLVRAWADRKNLPVVAWFDDRAVRQHDIGAQVRAILKADRQGRFVPGSVVYLRP